MPENKVQISFSVSELGLVAACLEICRAMMQGKPETERRLKALIGRLEPLFGKVPENAKTI